jgi:hypothetical protein
MLSRFREIPLSVQSAGISLIFSYEFTKRLYPCGGARIIFIILSCPLTPVWEREFHFTNFQLLLQPRELVE